MKITFYGGLAELLGREIDLAIEHPCTVGAVRGKLAAGNPMAAESLADGRVRVCVGSAMVGDEHSLGVGEEIEFLAPVSGG